MPNHVYNILKIEGKSEELLRFIQDNTRVDGLSGEHLFTFSKAIPEPLYEKEDGGFDWRVENWGTKWDAYEVIIHKGKLSNTVSLLEVDTFIVIELTTAWAPSTPVFIAFIERYPDLTFKIASEEEQCLPESYTLVTGKNGLYAIEEGNPKKTKSLITRLRKQTKG